LAIKWIDYLHSYILICEGFSVPRKTRSDAAQTVAQAMRDMRGRCYIEDYYGINLVEVEIWLSAINIQPDTLIYPGV
jgi:hypothetical protein